MSDDSIGEGPRREAADWMIELQDRPDDAASLARFATWRHPPANAAAWRDVERVTALIQRAGFERNAPRARAWRSWKIAAPVALAAIGTFWFAGSQFLPAISADHATGVGETRSLRLADGSVVTLAPRSAVEVEARHVRLLRGTAYFAVVHDAAPPFRVTAGNAIATDLGTAFEVRRDGDTTHVTVREGLVRTSCRDGWVDPAALRPGDTQALNCATGAHPHGKVVPGAVASWTDGQLVMTDRPLSEIVASLRPWHRGMLIARGAGMRKRVTGVYDLRHPDQALTALARAHHVKIAHVTPWVTIVSAD